ncbi:CDP-diacylglycerol--glycerol-3-phosphate 3-phosphatidyltransferase [Minicystis rosea]|nr:CDP-diacylglycerol--glycerol-3-phosphate 3-phosphatidyltransferase [Minicystis rosea]
MPPLETRDAIADTSQTVAVVAVAPARPRRLLALLGRHQLGSVVATVVDFGVMVLAVELLRISAVLGTLLGAAAGGIANFQLGRHWIFEAEQGNIAGQALRYALVSGASAGLNALGEYVVHVRLGVGYLPARAIVAVVVSLCWNFPMQRHFVFRGPAAARDRA